MPGWRNRGTNLLSGRNCIMVLRTGKRTLAQCRGTNVERSQF